MKGRPSSRGQDPPGVLGRSTGGTAAPGPLSDATPRPDSRPSAPAVIEQRRLPLGPRWQLHPCAPPPLAPLPTHTAPALLQSRRPDCCRLATARMRSTPAGDRRHRWRGCQSSVLHLRKCPETSFPGPGWNIVKVEVRWGKGRMLCKSEEP